jgi:glyoxylase-like metal-dependent hydrolase (beta-lactamase superfamily II)
MLEATALGPMVRIHLGRAILGRPLYTVNAYLVDGLLIDAGCPHTARELVDWCRDQTIHRIVNTHHHEDHAGGDALLRQRLDLPVLAPVSAVAVLAYAPSIPLYRRIVWGQPAPVLAQPLEDEVETDRYRFQVIPTPGHAFDHVCLFEPCMGWLFSGDLFIHERVRYLRADEDAPAILDSLRRVLRLEPRLLICSHAGVVEDACGAIERKINYWETLADRAAALRAEGLSLQQISNRLLGSEGVMTLVSRGEFARVNLIRSLLSEVSDGR